MPRKAKTEEDQAAAALNHVLDQLTGWATSTMLMLGLEAGLLDGILDTPATITGLAHRTGVNEPSTREWLGAMLAAGLVTVQDDVFTAIPGLHTALHPQAYPVNLRAHLRLPRTVPRLHDDLMRALRAGTGIPYREQRRASGRLTDDLNRPILREHLVRDWIGTVPGLTERLTDGATVVDLGCGTGYATRLLAAAFPASTFVGIDEDPGALTTPPHRSNVTYQLGGLDQLSTVDVVLLVNILHDLPQPKQAVVRIREHLRAGGFVVVVESSATGDLATDSARPRAVLGYLSSFVHCVQVSLAEGGTGPGAQWGAGPVLDALRTAGLTGVDSAELPPGRSVFWGRA